MLTVLLIISVVATVQTQYCLPCYGITCSGPCKDDIEGCAKCDGVISPKTDDRNRRGTCVEECSLHSDVDAPPCKEGYECKSNGCGHVCKEIIPSVIAKVAHSRRGSCLIGCNIYNLPEPSPLNCKEGYACLPNGCGMSCQKIDAPKKVVRRGACVIECDDGRFPDLTLSKCKVGYKCKNTGCGAICQKEEDIFGLCAELCDNGCPEGYACLSNGCGHSCQKVIA